MLKKLKWVSLSVFIFVIGFVFTEIYLIPIIGKTYTSHPEKINTHLSKEAKVFVESKIVQLNGKPIHDHHVHLLGLKKGYKSYLNPKLTSLTHPISVLKFKIYQKAVGIQHLEHSADEYVKHLKTFIQYYPTLAKFYIFAFDQYYSKDGESQISKSEFYFSNTHMFEYWQSNPEIFVPVVSIHPYREDALHSLEDWAQKGVKLVKWLPNSMNIDPSSESLIPFYQKLIDLKMTLITHTGKEYSVESHANQSYGNPLKYLLPLKMGVKIVMAHCASFGKCIDYQDSNQAKVSCYSLFERLMDDPRFESNLMGEISSVTLVNRDKKTLNALLNRTDLHQRLVYGSDYPLTNLNALTHLWLLKKNGFINSQEQKHLKEIYFYNPLLFDVMLKMTVRSFDKDNKFSPKLFSQTLF